MTSTRTIVIIAAGCVLTSVTALLYLRNEEPEQPSPARPGTQEKGQPSLIAATQRHTVQDGPTDAILSRYEGLAGNSIKEAFATLERETSGTQSSILRKVLAQLLVNKDFSKLEEVVACLPSGEEREFLLSVVVPRAVAKDMSGALTTIDGLGTTFRGQAYRHAVSGFLEGENFADAAAILNRMPLSEHRTRAVEAYASAVVGKDEAAFAALLESLPPEEVSGIANSAMLTLRMKKDSAGMQRLLPLVKDPFVKHIAIRSIVTTALDRGERESVTTTLAGLPAPDRELAKAILVVEDETISFPDGINQALQFQNQAALDSAVDGLVRRQLDDDPIKAGEKVLQLPDHAREIAIRSLISAWHQADRDQATDWLRRLPAGADRDAAINQIIPRLMRDDPKAAADVAALASTSEERERLLGLLSD
ncbi:MAG: hypothetical protein ACO1QR_05200 [Chthoniobacteraceae bacterium]